MQTELSLILIGIVLLMLLMIWFASFFGLEAFYRQRKIRKLRSTWSKLDAMAESNLNLTDEMREISEHDNINITLTDEDFQLRSSTSRNAEGNATRMFGFFSGFYFDDINIIEEKTDYTLQETSEERIHTNYLEMWGQLKNGDWCLLQTPLQSLESAAHMTIQFFVLIAAAVTALSVILIHLVMKRYTEPIAQLNALSKRMANLEFDARYTGDSRNEIGELGDSFNRMSDRLEKAVSELKAANLELTRDNERKTKMDEVRKEFLNNVSHELKTPIALISGYAEGLRDGIADDPESCAFYCDVIMEESAKMNTMVQKLLTLNQLEFGNDPVVMERFDLVQLIRGVVSGMGIMISEAGASVSFLETEPVYVWGDEFKIEEVVTNYLSNAVHHADGDRRIEIRIDRVGGGLIRTTVFNSGHPIPEEDIGRIFEKFYKVDKARTREYGGSGIGLSIVKAIMDGHGMGYGVRNYENGVAFWFELDGRSGAPAGSGEAPSGRN